MSIRDTITNVFQAAGDTRHSFVSRVTGIKYAPKPDWQHGAIPTDLPERPNLKSGLKLMAKKVGIKKPVTLSVVHCETPTAGMAEKDGRLNIWVTDGLLDLMNDNEIISTFYHEASHIRTKGTQTAIQVFTYVVPTLLAQHLSDKHIESITKDAPIKESRLEFSRRNFLANGIGIASYAALADPINHQFEYKADRDALAWADDPAVFASALRKMNQWWKENGYTQRPSHPNMDKRIHIAEERSR